MDYGLLAPMSVGQVHCSSSGSESCKGRRPNRCWVSTWIHPYTPTHYLLGALFLSCRVLHKYPAFVAPGAAQVPKGASSFAVFVLQGAAQVPCFCCSRCCASTYRGLIFCSVCLAGCCTSTLLLLLPVLRKYLQGPHFFAVFHASVSTGETEAKTEATNHGKKWWKNSFPALFSC